MNAPTPLIKTTNLTRFFRSDDVITSALNGINIEVENGEFVAVMGPSGCGKTTMLNLLGLIDKPTSGSYQFMGHETSSMSEKQKSQLRKGRIGFVFQNYNLIEELTVYENVELPLVYMGMKTNERRNVVKETLEKLKLIHRSDHFPSQLSGGQQQRVAIARAVITKPALLLADEPTGNLDSMNGEEVMEILNQLNSEGTTIIIVTHSERDSDYARRIIQLFDGKVIHENVHKASRNAI
ncbi:MAG: ABC transporter ATP-binding protein [Salinivirgaceae bacterium]|nr:ABC transporter ATP-binding protein [Salinivirgaceae bacterium]